MSAINVKKPKGLSRIVHVLNPILNGTHLDSISYHFFNFTHYSEFNNIRNEDGECVLIPGMTPLPSDDSVCRDDSVDFWYERTAYRKIPHSSCSGGKRLDRGNDHICPGPRHRSAWFWIFVILIPFAVCGAAAWFYTKKSGLARGYVICLAT